MLMKFLFIAPLPNSGGSILLNSLNSSQNISTLLPDPTNPADLKKFSFPTGEGEYSIINKPYRENPYTFGKFPIKQYKRSLYQYWNFQRPILCDKSPLFVQYAKQIEQFFSKYGEVYFILMIRDPNYSKRIKQIDWESLAETQQTNKQKLKNVCFITYEEMCENPESIRVKISQMLPELSDFRMSSEITKDFLKQEISPPQPKIRSEMSHFFGYTNKPIVVQKRVNKKEIRDKVLKEQAEKRISTQTENINSIIKGQVLKPGQILEAPKETKIEKPKVKVKKRAPRLNNKYLFILCPPFSGSTILHKIINTHSKISTFIGNPDAIEGQGQGFLIHDDKNYEPNRHNEEYELPVERLKQLFDKHWDFSKPILCDRSPPFVHFASEIESHFEQFGDVYFLIMIRNPYTTRWVEDSNWVRFAKEQKRNIETLKRTCWFTYEELIMHQESITEKIVNFLPELQGSEFNFDVGEIEFFNENDNRCKPISKRFLHRIDNKEEKNEILKDNKKLLDFFGYEYIE